LRLSTFLDQVQERSDYFFVSGRLFSIAPSFLPVYFLQLQSFFVLSGFVLDYIHPKFVYFGPDYGQNQLYCWGDQKVPVSNADLLADKPLKALWEGSTQKVFHAK